MGCYGQEGNRAHDCPASGERWENFANVVRDAAKLAGLDGVIFMGFKRDETGDILHSTASITNAPVFCSHELAAIRDIAIAELEEMTIRPDPVGDDEVEDAIGPTEGEA